MAMSVFPDVNLVIEPRVAAGTAASSKSLLRYIITGPERPLKVLHELNVVEMECFLSPVHPVTMPRKARVQAGIPHHATSFAFIYPSSALTAALSTRTNLSKDLWAFVLLLGGFAYFDSAGALLAVNAITFSPSDTGLVLIGPSATVPGALEAMKEEGRMQPVTLPELTQVGIGHFGWVHPCEQLGGVVS